MSLFLRHLGSHIPSSGVQAHAGYFRVSIIHRTLTRTAGIFNVRTWSFVCCAYTHAGGGVGGGGGVGHTDSESAQRF